jgi:hypothetical protein
MISTTSSIHNQSIRNGSGSQGGRAVPRERFRQLFTKPLPPFELALRIEPYERSVLPESELNQLIRDCASREEFAALAFILQNESSLEITKPLDEGGCRTLLDAVATNCAAAWLKLSDFEVDEATVKALDQLLKTSTTLASLTLVRCEIRDADRCELLVGALQGNRALKEIFFDGCFSHEPEPAPDSKQADNEESLHCLLANSHTAAESISELFHRHGRAILDEDLRKKMSSPVLSALSLHGQLAEQFAERLHARALERNSKLPFQPAQLVSLANLANLQALGLKACTIDNIDRLAPMLASLAANTHLERLDLTGNHVDTECLQALAEALSQNKALTSISFTWNGTDAALAPLVDALQKNLSLRELLITDAVLGKNGDTLSQLIERNKNHHFQLQIGAGVVLVAEDLRT